MAFMSLLEKNQRAFRHLQPFFTPSQGGQRDTQSEAGAWAGAEQTVSAGGVCGKVWEHFHSS